MVMNEFSFTVLGSDNGKLVLFFAIFSDSRYASCSTEERVANDWGKKKTKATLRRREGGQGAALGALKSSRPDSDHQ